MTCSQADMAEDVGMSGGDKRRARAQGLGGHVRDD